MSTPLVALERVAIELHSAPRKPIRDDNGRRRATALRTLRRFGMRLVNEPPVGCAWTGTHLFHATHSIPELYHELAHFQVAPEPLRVQQEFGLGSGVHTTLPVRTPLGYCPPPRRHFEPLASLLGILWLRAKGCPWQTTLQDHNWDFPNEILAEGLRPLYNLGFITSTGRPKFVVL